MDASTWTNAQRLALPDWCFPPKVVISAYRANTVALSTTFGISEVTLPDPAVIWEVGWLLMVEDASLFRFRIGLNATLPTTELQFNASQEVLPYFGEAMAGPNFITGGPGTRLVFIIPVRKVMITGGKYFVVSNYNFYGKARFAAWVLVSELPTQVPAHLDPNTI